MSTFSFPASPRTLQRQSPRFAGAAIVLGSLLASCGSEPVVEAAAGPLVDPKLPSYTPQSGLAGKIRAAGSDTLLSAVTVCLREFGKFHPEVQTSVEGRGSATGPPALSAGQAEIASMSRAMTGEELAAFETQHGYPPTGICFGVDGLGVFVHEDNPIDQLNLQQIDAIFSSTRARGYGEPITNWGQLARIGDYTDATIQKFGRDHLSGTYGAFKDKALLDGDFANDVTELPGSAAVVRKVAQDPFAIGYAGIAFRMPGVKALALAEGPEGPYYSWGTARFFSTDHPLARRIYLYVDKAPSEPLDPALRAFLDFALSAEGQKIVADDGYVAIAADVADIERKKLD